MIWEAVKKLFLDALASLGSMLESQSLSHSIIHVFEIFGIYLGHVFGNFGNIFGISGAKHGNIFGILLAYFGHSLGIPWAYFFVEIFSRCMYQQHYSHLG